LLWQNALVHKNLLNGAARGHVIYNRTLENCRHAKLVTTFVEFDSWSVYLLVFPVLFMCTRK